MNNLDLVFSLFNINVFQQAKNNITDIQYYFDTNASTSGNKLIGELIDAIKTYNFDQIDLPLFNSILTRCGKTPAESSKIVGELIKWKSYNKKQMEPAKRFLDDIVANSIIQRANRLYDEHPADFLKYLKNAEFKTSTLDTLSSTAFGQIDINSVMENEMSDGVTSCFDFINQSFKPDCKYPMGQMGIICMPPGCFVGDTEVILADGTTKTMKELCETDQKNLTVYACDGDYPRISVAEKCIKTKEVTELIEIEIDDGGKIKSTPDHRYMMIDGSYKEAKDLKEGDLLMPLNIKHIPPRTKSDMSSGCYTQVWTRDVISGFMTHRLTADYIKKKHPELYYQRNLVAHHNGLDKDGKFNRYDNRVESILLIPDTQHRKIHAIKQMEDKKKLEGFLEVGKDTRINSDQVSDWNKRNWKDPEYREKMLKLLKENAPKARKNMDALLEKRKIEWGFDRVSYNVLNGLKYGKKLIEDGLAKTQEELIKIWDDTRMSWDKSTKKHIYYLNSKVPKLRSMKKALGKEFDNLFKHCKNYTNHEIVSVKKIVLDKPEPVYDIINVDLYSNFAIKTSENSGIFVHNCGKTLAAFNEALHMAAQGRKCHYLAMGDISYRDFIIRMCAIYSGLPFWDAKSNVKTIFNGISQLVGNNLEITIVPAGTLTVDEYVDYVLSRDFEILFADYDGNFKVPGLENNMYLAYGSVYEKLTKLTLAGKLVFIMSQPHKNFYGNEVLELSDVGESSKKIQSIDFLITRGRVVGNPNHLGKFKIAKNRRGEEGVEVGSIRLNNGRFMIVSDGVYDMLKQDKTKKNYTESDIRAMEASYAANANQIQHQLNQAANRMNNNGGGQRSNNQYSVSGPTPFSRP